MNNRLHRSLARSSLESGHLDAPLLGRLLGLPLLDVLLPPLDVLRPLVLRRRLPLVHRLLARRPLLLRRLLPLLQPLYRLLEQPAQRQSGSGVKCAKDQHYKAMSAILKQ